MIKTPGITNGSPLDDIPPLPPPIYVERPETDVDTDRLASFLRSQCAPTLSFRGFKHRTHYRRAGVVLRALEGLPLCGPKDERNNIWFKQLCGTVGDILARAPSYDPIETEALAVALSAVFTPALAAQLNQDSQPGARRHTELDIDRVTDMFTRSLADRRAKVAQDAAKALASVPSAPSSPTLPITSASILDKLKGRSR